MNFNLIRAQPITLGPGRADGAAYQREWRAKKEERQVEEAEAAEAQGQLKIDQLLKKAAGPGIWVILTATSHHDAVKKMLRSLKT